ncbi:MAG TPA: pirin-like C-terminal cupin domain-containing protein, partial [Candidatus Thermoplasmatota archaeon]|nr:pirin-like C-terminal cupin domain-containing protein [Candidatus Thermoplasmatota archaeon]
TEATVRVIAGRFGDVDARIDTRTPVQYLHVRLEAGASLRVPVPDGQQGFAYVLGGDGLVGGTAVAQRIVAVLAGDGEVTLDAGASGLDAIVVSGVPLREPVFQWGPFVMNERKEILQAVADFESGKMGRIAPRLG